jgi:CMP-N-acetylneuraminic acid synthetase
MHAETPGISELRQRKQTLTQILMRNSSVYIIEATDLVITGDKIL